MIAFIISFSIAMTIFIITTAVVLIRRRRMRRQGVGQVLGGT